jgi:hypothetical protein
LSELQLRTSEPRHPDFCWLQRSMKPIGIHLPPLRRPWFPTRWSEPPLSFRRTFSVSAPVSSGP